MIESARVFYHANGTAHLNTTTVAITAAFAGIVGLGVWSVFHEAGLKAQQAQAKKDEQEYEEEYAEYLRKYQQWAETYGQNPVPPQLRNKKTKRFLLHNPGESSSFFVTSLFKHSHRHSRENAVAACQAFVVQKKKRRKKENQTFKSLQNKR